MEGGGVTQKKAKNRGRKRRGVDSVGDELHNRKVCQQVGMRQSEGVFVFVLLVKHISKHALLTKPLSAH